MFREIEENRTAEFMENIDMPCTACRYYYCNEERGYICMFSMGCVYGNQK